MSGRWLGIRVDLIGGRGQILDPPPGRTFAVPPSCTFDDFGRAIDLAFARWDLSHLREFTLDDGTLVVNEEMAERIACFSVCGAIPRTMLLSAKASPRLKVGSRFRYIFDLSDDWTHACTVEGHLDPLEVLGNIRISRRRTGAGERRLSIWPAMGFRRRRSAPPISRSEEEIELRWSKHPLAPLIDLKQFRGPLPAARQPRSSTPSVRSRSKPTPSRRAPAF